MLMRMIPLSKWAYTVQRNFVEKVWACWWQNWLNPKCQLSKTKICKFVGEGQRRDCYVHPSPGWPSFNGETEQNHWPCSLIWRHTHLRPAVCCWVALFTWDFLISFQNKPVCQGLSWTEHFSFLLYLIIAFVTNLKPQFVLNFMSIYMKCSCCTIQR